MRKFLYLYFILVTPFRSLCAQDIDSIRIAHMEPDSIALAPLIYLASDELQGRFIGGSGITAAANYIVAQLRKAGARPAPGTTSYFQVFTKTLGRYDLRKAGIGQRYNMPGVEPDRNYTLKNIVAYIPGSDTALRREYIMLSAHYDHLGFADDPTEADGKKDNIYNGARDNATGTTAVLAAARFFGKYPPRRSVLLVFFTAEEEGEFGSEYYANYPLVPLNKTIFDLNNDNAGYNSKHAICLFGLHRTSADSVIEKACLKYGLAVLAEPAALNLFERSDNYNLAKTGIPAPCFSMGIKNWDHDIDRYYHQLDDEVGNMDLDYVVRFIHAYILSAQYIANNPKQPRWTRGDEFEKAWLSLYASHSHLNASPQHASLPPLAHP